MTAMSFDEFYERLQANPRLTAMFERAMMAAEINIQFPETQDLARTDPEALEFILRTNVLATIYMQACTSREMFEPIVTSILKAPVFQLRHLH